MQGNAIIRILGRAIFLVLVYWFAEGGLCASAQPTTPDTTPKGASSVQQQIKANLIPEASSAKAIGHVAPETTIRLAISLVIPKYAELQSSVKDIYDQGSLNYRHFLTPEQFTALYSPSSADYQKVQNWAKTNHLKVERTYPNRLLVIVSGSAAHVERAVHVKLEEALRADKSKFYRPDRDPSIQLSVPITAITGLDNFERPRHFGGSSPTGTFIAGDLRKSYADGSQLTGRNQTIGIMVFDGYITSDIDDYRTDAHLSVLKPGQLTYVLATGITAVPVPQAWSFGETTADIEMAMAMAPDANVKVYIGDQSTNAACKTTFDDLINQMSNDHATLQFSNSYGCIDWAVVGNSLSAMAMQGQSFFVPSGDYGGWPNGNAPYSDLMVTIVGGTTLTMNGNGVSRASEVPWDAPATTTFPYSMAGGGGVGTTLASPSYQSGTTYDPGSGASTTNRNEPDLSIVATGLYFRAHLPTTPTTYYNSFSGTSAGAPLMAGFMALANERWALAGMSGGIGWASPAIWNIGRNPTAYSAAFNDIATGGTHSYLTTPGPNFNATPGYDLATGWGTPKPALIDQLACVQLSGSGHVASTPPNCEVSIGTTLGEPHITTMDGLYYDFQAAGDFLLATTGSSFIVQARQRWTPNYPNVAFNKAVAMQMGKTRVAVFLDPTRLVVDGRPKPLDDGKSLLLPDNVEVSRTGNVYLVRRNSGETVRIAIADNAWVGILGGDFMDVTVSLNYKPNGKLRGLLGNGNGDLYDDFITRDGVVLKQPFSFKDFYLRFAESMHVQNEESLFGEERLAAAGENTSLNSGFEIPTKAYNVKNLSPRAYKSARAACLKAGVVSAPLLDGCTLDVAVLGSPAVAKIYKGSVRPFAFLDMSGGIKLVDAASCGTGCLRKPAQGSTRRVRFHD